MSSAVQAAIEAAEQIGIWTTDPLLLQETNNTVIWLRPEPVVAKVAVREHSKAEIRLEHAVAVELAALGAEIARPLAGTSPVLHPASGFVVTFWERLKGADRTPVAPSELAGSLQRLHSALSQTEVELPSFRAMLVKSHRVLEEDSFRATSPPSDLELLTSTYDRGFAALDSVSFDGRRLHGEPHDGNRIKTDTGLRWIDFESCCVGPLEWDLAFQPESVVRLFPETGSSLLALLRSLNSARVATWCLRSNHPDMRQHGEIHMALLRQSSGDPWSFPAIP